MSRQSDHKHSVSQPGAPLRAPWYARVPWTAVALSLVVILTSAFAVSPVREFTTQGDIVEAFLVRSPAYVAIAPLSGVLDMLTLLAAPQHIALVSAAVVLFIAWLGFSAWRSPTRPTWMTHLRAAGIFLGVVVALYAATAFLPRPMAALRSNDPNILIVDFHSHSDESHDGLQSIEQLRAWHAAAGYDVAYVTDHATVVAAERGIAANPDVSADGTMLFQSIETTWDGEHVSILGAERMYMGLLTNERRDVDVDGLRLASLVVGREPVVIWNHPRQMGKLPVASVPGTFGIRAMEVINGAPKDAARLRANRDALIAFADSANLALTTGSDNHGFGNATPGWTLMRVLSWRGMAGDVLDQNIQNVLRERRYGSTAVVERRVADPGSSQFLMAATIVAAPLRMFTTLSTDERVSWLVWIWILTAALWWMRRSR